MSGTKILLPPLPINVRCGLLSSLSLCPVVIGDKCHAMFVWNGILRAIQVGFTLGIAESESCPRTQRMTQFAGANTCSNPSVLPWSTEGTKVSAR
jgi:hypothetical protein